MGRPIFLDRDGVINFDLKPYITHASQIRLIPGSVEAIAALCNAGFDVYVVSNQQGVAKGFIEEAELDRMSAVIQDALLAHGAQITRIYYCTAHDDDAHPWRKPAPGMILAARDEFDLDLRGAFMIGDRWSDIEAGHAAGLRPLLVLTGVTSEDGWREWETPPEAVFEDLAAAVAFVLAN